MRLLADMHISPQTVGFLRSLGHDVQRIPDLLPIPPGYFLLKLEGQNAEGQFEAAATYDFNIPEQ